ncbi:hypothetical protein FRC09_008062 [Ceratobasidium sp. 395]|nr:hypothetical protein FRC09_008062 [Ceratobasidium sp. 395]
MNDYMCESFAAQHPDMAFIHAFPGIVRTPMLTDFHWSIKLLLPVLRPFSVSPAECAQWMLYTLLDPQFSKGAFFRNSNADDAGPNKYSTPELRKLVWEHTLKRTSGSA